jgi:phosphorylcholine metabolism protein LicD
MNKIEAKQVLFDVIDTLEKYQIDYFLFGGTLLGAIREKDFIENDNDIDIGILQPFWENNILFQQITWNLLSKDIKICNLAATHVMNLNKNGIGVDLCYFKKENNYHVTEGCGWKIKIPSHYLKKLESITFLGKKCYIPNNIENFLTEFYTDTWKNKISHNDTKFGLLEWYGEKEKIITFTTFLYIYKDIINKEN